MGVYSGMGGGKPDLLVDGAANNSADQNEGIALGGHQPVVWPRVAFHV